jgi:hypothetical protein
MKRKLRLLGIFLIFAIPLLYFLFTLLFFSPFEESFGRIDYIIPRQVDIFFSKAGLKDDFYEFPIPKFYTELEISHNWRAFTKTDLFLEVTNQLNVESVLDQLKANTENLPFVTPVDDFIGREVAVAGNFKEGGAFPYSCLVFFKGSWKTKLIYELLTWDLVRKNVGDARLSQSTLVPNPLGYNTLMLKDGTEFYMRRVSDLIVFGDDENLMMEVCELINAEKGSIDLSIGGMEAYITKVASTPRVDMNYLDFHANVERIFQRVTFDDQWKDNKIDFSVMTAMEIFDPDFFKTITGAIRFGNFLDLDAKVDFNPQTVTKAETGFFGLGSVSIAEKLDFFATMLPEEVFFSGCTRLNLGRVLRIMERSMNVDLRKLITDILREGQRYNKSFRIMDTSHFIDFLDGTFGDLAYIALRPRDEDKPIQPLIQPIPILALALEIKNMQNFKIMEETVREMQNNNRTPFELWKYTNPTLFNCIIKGINTTQTDDIEKVAWTVLEDRYFILATSDNFILDMLRAKATPALSLKKSKKYRPAADFFKVHGNLAFYLETGGLKNALSNYAVYWAELNSEPDWETERPKARAEVLRREFPRYANQKELPASVEAKVKKRVQVKMNELTRIQEEEEIPRLTEEFRKYLTWIDLLECLVLQVNLNRNDVDLGIRISSIL